MLALGLTLTVVRDRLYRNDVGLLRLRSAIAATAATGVCLGVLFAGSTLLGQRPTFVVPGLLVTAVACMGLSMEPRAGRRAVTVLLMAGPAAVGLVLSAWLSNNLVALAVGFLGLCLATLLASLAGSRGILLALSAIGNYYAGSLVPAGANTLAALLASIVLGSLTAALTLAILAPQRPRTDPRRLVRSLDAQRTQLQTAIETGDNEATLGLLGRINHTLGIVRDHVATHPNAWCCSAQDVDGELAQFETRTEMAVAAAMTPPGTPGYRVTLPEFTPSLPTRRRRCKRCLEDQSTSKPIQVTDDPPTTDRDHRESRGAPEPDPRPASRSETSQPHATLPPASGGRDQISLGVQLMVAAVLSVSVSMTIDPQLWFWGVLAALVSLFGTSSASESIGKGTRRMLGTVAAIPLGAVLALALGDFPLVLGGCVLIAIFLQQYVTETAYGWSIFWLTLALYSVFALIGADAGQTLSERAVLTAAGGVIGVAVALVVLPSRTGTRLRERALDVSSAAGATVRRMLAREGGPDVRSALSATRDRLISLKNEADAAQRGWPLAGAHRIFAAQIASAAMAVRQLAAVVDDYDPASVPEPDDERALQLAEHLLELVMVNLGKSHDAEDLQVPWASSRRPGVDEPLSSAADVSNFGSDGASDALTRFTASLGSLLTSLRRD